MHDFAGFPPEATDFLKGLQANNDRAWFAAHRQIYEEALKAPGTAFSEAVRERLEDLIQQPVRAKMFRIHRDVRFSKNKSPYNAHLHIAFFASAAASGFYAGLEPERLVLGAGAFDLPSPRLDCYRAAVADPAQGAALSAILDSLGAAGFRLEGATLKRTPAPYPDDHPNAALLRRKGLTAWRDITDAAVIASPGVIDACVESFAALAPLTAWLTRAIRA